MPMTKLTKLSHAVARLVYLEGKCAVEAAAHDGNLGYELSSKKDAAEKRYREAFDALRAEHRHREQALQDAIGLIRLGNPTAAANKLEKLL